MNNDDFFNDEDVKQFIDIAYDKNIDNQVEIIKESTSVEEVTRKMFNFVISQLDEILKKNEVLAIVKDKILDKINNEELKLSELQSLYKMLAEDMRFSTLTFTDLFKRGKDGSDTVFTNSKLSNEEDNFLDSLTKSDIQTLVTLLENVQKVKDEK